MDSGGSERILKDSRGFEDRRGSKRPKKDSISLERISKNTKIRL